MMRIATLGVLGASLFLLAAPIRAQVVFNEVLYDPGPDIATGDANGNGVRESSGDEFVELVNAGVTAVDLSGFVIEDAASFPPTPDPAFVRHTFPAGSVVQPGRAIVVFGREGMAGPTPVGTFGGATVQVASSNALGLNNTSETLYLVDPSGATVATLATDANVPQDQSFARNLDGTGAFVGHQSISTNAVRYSPGLRNTFGTPFSSAGTTTGETPVGGLSMAVANPLRGASRVAFTADAAEATLVLYDVLGRRVAALADGASARTATLDAARLAPGVYVLRLTAGADVLTRTVTVVR